MVTLLSAFPPCPVRAGRCYDGIMVVCCGYREIVDAMECVMCKNNDGIGMVDEC